jgi:hypothetical protein
VNRAKPPRRASYDEKVDLFSLGVVVFEMWHPFTTGMERAVLLRDLREAGKLPEQWEKLHPTVARLVRCGRQRSGGEGRGGSGAGRGAGWRPCPLGSHITVACPAGG